MPQIRRSWVNEARQSRQIAVDADSNDYGEIDAESHGELNGIVHGGQYASSRWNTKIRRVSPSFFQTAGKSAVADCHSCSPAVGWHFQVQPATTWSLFWPVVGGRGSMGLRPCRHSTHSGQAERYG